MALGDTNVARAVMGLGMPTPQVFPEPAVAGTFDSEDAAAMLDLSYVDFPSPAAAPAYARSHIRRMVTQGMI